MTTPQTSSGLSALGQPALPDFELVPEATPATADLVCWIWAAFPPHRGTINQTRVADALGVSRRTFGRWLADAEGRSFDAQTRAKLARRAILRGHGTYLWPDLDPATRYRSRGEVRNAYTAYQAIAATAPTLPPGTATAPWSNTDREALTSRGYDATSDPGVGVGDFEDSRRRSGLKSRDPRLGPSLGILDQGQL